jgi:4'-phosphopantetheinyl transferase
MSEPLPTDGMVDLWVVSLIGCPESAFAILSADERVRAERRVDEERRRFIASHVGMRQILAGYSGQPAPEAIRLVCPYGEKPRAPGVELSLTHRHDLALVAVAQHPLGADLEAVDSVPIAELSEFAEFALSDDELAHFRTLPHSARPIALHRSWVRKEAYLKACGLGVSDRVLAEVEVSRGDEPPVLLRGGSPAGEVSLVDIDPAPWFVAAVAMLGAEAHVRLRKHLDWC